MKNDNDNARFRGGYPALNVLAKHNPEAAREAWRLICDARQQTQCDVPPIDGEYNADDADHIAPDVELTSETMLSPTAEGPDDIHVETLHEIKPGIHTMLRAAGGVAWPWCGQREKKDGKWIWRGEPWQYFYCLEAIFDGETTELGGLEFYTKPKARREAEGGMLVSYTNTAGVEHRPAYKTSKPRGGKRPRRTLAAAWAYLAKPAAISSALRAEGYQRPISTQAAQMPMYTPQQRREPNKGLDIYGQVDRLGRFGVVEARAEIERCMETAPPATHCPTVIAKGAWFLGGMTASKETASAPGPSWHYPDPPLSPVLEEVAARGNLESIGRVIGYRGGAADRAGKKALLAEGKALVAENNNSKKKVAA
jgi:hypothetical protein